MMLFLVATIKALPRAVFSSVVVASITGQKLFFACFADYGLSAAIPVDIMLACVMFCGVFSPANEYEVLMAIVCLIAIYVMHKFMCFERASESFTHYKPVFGNISNISLFQRIGMLGTQNVDVSIFRHETSAKPTRVALAFRLMSRDVSAIASVFHSVLGGLARFKLHTATAFAQHKATPFDYFGIVTRSIRASQMEVRFA